MEVLFYTTPLSSKIFALTLSQFSSPFLFFPLRWNATSVWPCDSSLPHWPHQCCLSYTDVVLTQTLIQCNTHAHSYAYTHLHTLLRHSPVVWPVTTRQLFLLCCWSSHDVRALLCVIGWRLSASCVCGRYDVGDCRSLCHRESWLKWSAALRPLTLQLNTCVFLLAAL